MAAVAYTPTAAIRATLRRNHIAKLVAAFIVLVVVVAIFAPVLAPHDPNAQDLTLRLRPPVWAHGAIPGHLLGTDHLGRDVLSRVIYGSRVSLLVGVSATLVAGIIGALAGLIAGYFGGWRDAAIMRLADVQLAFPSILLALALVAVLGPSLLYVIVVLGATGWVSYARVVRAEVLSLRSREFVTAARAAGVSDRTIVRRHLLPNVMAPLATVGTLQVASMIITEASLSYLGLGVPKDVVTWGAMLHDGQLYLSNAWWLAVLPGVAIMLTTLSINIAGDMLRDIADPKAYMQ
jgi:peptide/nickel transport system permease protein